MPNLPCWSSCDDGKGALETSRDTQAEYHGERSAVVSGKREMLLFAWEPFCD